MGYEHALYASYVKLHTFSISEGYWREQGPPKPYIANEPSIKHTLNNENHSDVPLQLKQKQSGNFISIPDVRVDSLGQLMCFLLQYAH